MNEAPEPYAVRTRTVHGTALRKRDVRHRTPCAVGGCKGTFIQGRNGRAARGLGFPKHRKSILKMYRIKWVNSIEMYRKQRCVSRERKEATSADDKALEMQQNRKESGGVQRKVYSRKKDVF